MVRRFSDSLVYACMSNLRSGTASNEMRVVEDRLEPSESNA